MWFPLGWCFFRCWCLRFGCCVLCSLLWSLDLLLGAYYSPLLLARQGGCLRLVLFPGGWICSLSCRWLCLHFFGLYVSFKRFNCFIFRFGLELAHLYRRRNELVLRCWNLLHPLRLGNSCLRLCLFLRHATRLRFPCAIGRISHKLCCLRRITAPVSP